MFYTGADGVAHYVNDALARIAGYPVEEMVGKLWHEKIHPEDRDTVTEQWLANVDKIEPWTAEYRFLSPDGTVTWVMGHTNPQLDANGQVISHVGTITDITDRKRMEEQLRESHRELEIQVKERTRELLESESLLTQSAVMANLGYAVWDYSDEKYLSVSDEYAGIFGYTSEEFLATFSTADKNHDLIYSADRERHQVYYDRDRSDNQSPDIEYRIVRRDGDIRHILQATKYVADRSGERTLMFISLQDITDRKQAEQELQN
ncbi:MAG: PAS domain S-box protein, partial [Gammaproteobacteria bacterium]|nr:PAS domain S-box protein [Gammaproteobacteria bacterium]